MALPAVANAAFNIGTFSSVPSTRQAAAHPSLNTTVTRTGTFNEDLRDLTVEMPAGMAINPEAASVKCTNSQFASDSCPGGSYIGTFRVRATVESFLPWTANFNGSVYMLTPGASDHATLGYILRPGFLLPKTFVKQALLIGESNDYAATGTVTHLPRTQTLWFPSWLGTQNITIQQINSRINARAGSTMSGGYLLTNPTRCSAATSKATATSYQGVTVTKSTSFTPLNCSLVPFNPSASVAVANNTQGQATGTTAEWGIPTTSSTLQNSHVKKVEIDYPSGSALSASAVTAIGAGCSAAQLASNTCPASSHIGTSSLNLPSFPPAFSGHVYATDPVGASSVPVAAVLDGPRGMRIVLRGTLYVAGGRASLDFDNLPQFPIELVSLNLSSTLVTNPTGCGSQTISTTLTGYTGATATRTSTYSTVGCVSTPDTTIVTAPSAVTSDTTGDFTFSSTDVSATFECDLDGSGFSACPTPYATGVLSDGSHTLNVRATNLSGTDPTPATFTWIVDTIAPSVSVTAPPNGSYTSDTTPALAFTATDANPGVTECQVDLGAFAACPASLSALSNGLHTVTVRHTDAAGNSASASSSFTVDAAAPIVSISSPPNGSTTTSSTSALTFTVSESNPGTTDCDIDGGGFAPCPASIGPLADGSHSVVVRHTDLAGNVGSATSSWTIDTTTPDTTIDSPPAALSNDTTPTVVFSASEAATFECSVDSGTYAPCTSPATFGPLGDGSHTIDVRATDTAGNADPTPASTSFVIDTLAPALTIDSPSNGDLFATDSVAVSFTSELGVSFTCAIDLGAPVACISPQPYSSLADGSHTVVVTATDLAGNSNTDSVTFEVDTTDPVVTISSPLSGSITSNDSPTLSFAVTEDNPGTTECQVDGGGYSPCSSGSTVGPLADGSHTIDVRHTDAAGNVGSDATTFTVDTTLPAVSIDSPVHGQLYNGAPVPLTVTATDANPGSTECSIDSGAFGPCAATLDLADGTHTVDARHTDDAGNVGNAAQVTFDVDSTNPVVTITAPLDGSITNGSNPPLSFSVADANPGTSECSVDGAMPGPCGPSLGVLADGSHFVTVTHTDAVGNVGSATSTFTVDTTAPLVSIDSPVDGTLYNGAPIPLTVTATDDNPGSTECSIDSGAFGPCSATLDLADGTHTVDARHTDAASNVGVATTVTFEVDGTAPSVSIDSPVTGTLYDGDPIPLTVTATDANPGSTECSIDSGAFGPCSPTLDLGDGSHTVDARHTDAAGNIGTATQVTFEVDGTAPSVSIDSPVTGTLYDGDPIPLTVTATDANPGSTECSIDSGAFGPCSPTLDLGDGSHTVDARHTDAAGNIGTATQVTFEVDGTAPSVSIDSPVDGTLYDGDPIPLTVTATDANPGTTECSIDGGAFGPCSPTLDLGDGSHTVDARHTDAAGNIGVATQITFEVDGTAPSVSIDSPVDGTLYSGAPIALTIALTEANPGSTECSIDSGAFGPCAATLDLGDGLHTVDARHTDAVGNIGNAAQVSFTVDGTAPTVTIDSPVNGNIYGDDPIPVTVSASDAHPGSTECSVDGGVYGPCPATLDLADGSHTLDARHTDAVGNVGTAATSTFTVDTSAPVVTITAPPTGDVVPTDSVTLNFSVDVPSTVTCDIDGDGFLPCADGQVYSSLDDGSHTITVRAVATSNGAIGLSSTTFTVDTVDPLVSIDSPDDGVLYDGDAIPLTVTATDDNPGTTECSIDSGAFGPCSPTLDLGDGSHTVDARHTDAAGNVGTATQVTFEVDGTAPSVSIDSPVDGTLYSGAPITLTVTATDANPGTTECSIDSGTFGPCPPSLDLADGSHTVDARHTDAVGNIGTATQVQFDVDSTPGGVTIESPIDGELYNGDPIPVTITTTEPGTLECSVDGGAFASCPATLDLSDGPHTLEAQFTDGSSNVSNDDVSFTVDGTAPTVSITSPVDGTLYNGDPIPVTVSAADAHPGTTECSVDSGAFGPCPATLDLGDGPHTLDARHTDLASNVGTATQVSFSVDGTDPSVSIDSPIDGTAYNGDPITVTVSATDANPGTTECSVDSGAFGPCPAMLDLGDGPHTLDARHTDDALNVGTATQVSFTVDGTAPTTTIDVAPSDPTTDHSPTWEFSSDDPSATFECSLVAANDAPSFGTCSGPGNTHTPSPDLADGEYDFAVRASDAVGNTDASPAEQLDLTVETAVAVETQITHGPEGGLDITDPTPQWEFTSNIPAATFECSLDGAPFATCTSPYQIEDERGTGGPNGFDVDNDGGGAGPNSIIDNAEAAAHTFEVRAVNGVTPDPTPDLAAFDTAVFAPTFTVTQTDPQDPTDLDGNDATAHPDVTLNALNPAGDPENVIAYGPDYTWGSNYAVPKCQLADATAGTCDAASQVGEVTITADVNRVPHDSIAGMHTLALTGTVYLTEAWAPGEAAGAVAEIPIVDTDSRNYGTVNQEIHLVVDTISTDDTGTPLVEENTSVFNPRGLKARVEGVPRISPLAVDGAQLEMHGRSLDGTIWGNRPNYDVPLLTNSADCSGTPDPDVTPRDGEPSAYVEWRGTVETYEHTGNTDRDSTELFQLYTVDNCESVPFAPIVENLDLVSAVDGKSTTDALDPPPAFDDYIGDSTPDESTPLTATATVSVPPESSTLRSSVINLPPSLRQRNAGLTGKCSTGNAQQNADVDFDIPPDGIIDITDYVACNPDESLIGTAEVISPLVETPQQGDLYIEDTGGAIPALYAIVRNEELGLNARIRAYPETVGVAGGLSYLRTIVNASASNTPVDLPSIPVTKLTLDIFGTPLYGPVLEVASACVDEDAGYGTARSWSDPDLDGDGKTTSIIGPKMYFGNSTGPAGAGGLCVPASDILTNNPADPDGQPSPTAGDITLDDTPSWTGTRDYTNSTASTRFAWLECSTDNLVWSYCNDFSRGVDEIQRITKTGAGTTGSYTITFNGSTTAPITCGSAAAAVDTALELLPSVGFNNVLVTGGALSGATPLTITYINALGGANQPQATATITTAGCGTALTGSTTTEGAAGPTGTSFGASYMSVPAGGTATLTRVVNPQAGDLPLSSGNGHKFSLRLKSNGTAPPCTVASCVSTVAGTVYNPPGISFYTAEVPFKVDNEAPTGTTFMQMSPADGADTNDSPVYYFTATDVTVQYECSIDSGPWVACPSGEPLPGAPFSLGLHTVEVRGFDGINVDATPAMRSFTVVP